MPDAMLAVLVSVIYRQSARATKSVEVEPLV